MFWEKIKNFFYKKNQEGEESPEITIFSPMTGRAMDLKQVPDPTFSHKTVGDGMAILPTEGAVFSPFDGRVTKLFHTKHACILQSTCQSTELLIHIGIDTVKLQGEGFNTLVQEGDIIQRGTPLIEIDLARLQSHGLSLISPIIISKMADKSTIKFFAESGSLLTAGESILMKV